MGTHERSSLDRLKVGSVADAVLRRAHCPVFTIRAPDGGHPAVHPLRLNFGRILVATDFSPSSEAALRRAAELARLLHAEIVLLHVTESPPPSSSASSHATDSAGTRTEEKFRQVLSASRSDDVVGERPAARRSGRVHPGSRDAHEDAAHRDGHPRSSWRGTAATRKRGRGCHSRRALPSAGSQEWRTTPTPGSFRADCSSALSPARLLASIASPAARSPIHR